MTKYIRMQCLEKARCVDLPMVGKFIKERPNTDKEQTEPQYIFIPHLDFVDSGKFSFPENQFNLSPFSKNIPQTTSITVSGTGIAQVTALDRDLVNAIIKEIFAKLVRKF